MIRINLLPFREVRKKENIRRQLSIFLLSVVLLICAMIYFYIMLNNKVEALEAQREGIKKELAKYRDTTKKLKEIKKKINEMRTKLEVIRTLERNKQGPVRLLDEIAMAVPKDKLWLNSLKETKGILVLEGTAMDNETVAFFMTALERQPHIKSVDLKMAKLRRLKKYKLDLTDFKLECKTYLYKEKKPKKAKGKGKKRRRR